LRVAATALRQVCDAFVMIVFIRLTFVAIIVYRIIVESSVRACVRVTNERASLVIFATCNVLMLYLHNV